MSKKTCPEALFHLFRMSFVFALLGCGGGTNTTLTRVEPVAEAPPPMRILVIGQSISSNCNAHMYGPVPNVLQVGLSGEEKPAVDPFEWADCKQGAMWIPFGQKLLESRIASKVVFMPIGVSGTKVQDWQVGGVAYSKLNDAIALIKRERLTFDFAIWHQGSADNGTSADEYLQRLSSVVGYVSDSVTIRRWLIGVHSRCWGLYDPNIEAAQKAFGNAPALARYPGANSNLLGEEYRIDTCHLNKNGQDEMSSMWLKAIQNAIGSNKT